MFDGLLQLNVLHIKDIVGLDGIVNVFLAILRFLIGLLFFWLRCGLQTWPVIYVYGRLLFFILVYGSGCFVNVPLGSVGYLNATVEAKRGSYLARHNRKGRLVP